MDPGPEPESEYIKVPDPVSESDLDPDPTFYVSKSQKIKSNMRGQLSRNNAASDMERLDFGQIFCCLKTAEYCLDPP